MLFTNPLFTKLHKRRLKDVVQAAWFPLQNILLLHCSFFCSMLFGSRSSRKMHKHLDLPKTISQNLSWMAANVTPPARITACCTASDWHGGYPGMEFRKKIPSMWEAGPDNCHADKTIGNSHLEMKIHNVVKWTFPCQKLRKQVQIVQISMPSQSLYIKTALHNRPALVAQKRQIKFEVSKTVVRCLWLSQISLSVHSLQWTSKLRQLLKVFSSNLNKFSLFFTKSKVTSDPSSSQFKALMNACK